MAEESYEDKIARIAGEVGIERFPAIVLGSLRSRGMGEDIPFALAPEEILLAIHGDRTVRNLVWVGVDQCAVKYEWFEPIVDLMVNAWPGHAEEQHLDVDDPFARKEFFAERAVGEIAFFGAWRMWRSNQLDFASKALTTARKGVSDWRALDILEYILAHPDEYPYDKMPMLHTHGADVNVCTGGDLDERFPYDGLAPSSDWL